MIRTFKHYLSVYSKILEVSFAKSSSFRLHFFLVILMDFLFYLVSIQTIKIIYDQVGMIGPWDENHFLFFTAFVLCIDQIHMMVLSQNFWYFSEYLRTGEFDYYLLRPISSLFMAFFNNFNFSYLLNAFFTWGLLIYYGIEIQLTFYQWIIIPPLFVVSFIFQFILEILIATSMFWTIKGLGVNILRLELQRLSRWPDFIFARYFKFVFTFAFPVLLIGSTPVKIIFQEANFSIYLLFLLLLSCFSALLYFFWKKGIRQYDSASS